MERQSMMTPKESADYIGVAKNTIPSMARAAAGVSRGKLSRIKDDLKKLDLNTLTSLEALNYLDRLQKRFNDKA